ncbi:MAG: MazG nucleotide pyrophosphohydrolase domain-containing protein [bacterium JZ-2024 1]
MKMNEKFSEWEKIIRLIEVLRGEKGCAWDRGHHFSDYLKMMREEMEELSRAYEQNSPEHIREELGDVLWNAIYLLCLAREEWNIMPEEVLRGVREKMVHRHPHIFGDIHLSTPEEVSQYWEKMKKKEKKSSSS